MRGLLWRRTLPPGEGIVLRPAWSIHTAFMQFPIDVVFLDRELVVLRIDGSLKPFRTASVRGAWEIVELSAGECERRGLSLGDRVAWASYSAARSGEGPKQAGGGRHAAHRPRALVASRDARFVKLARFLLDQAGIDQEGITPDRLQLTLESDDDVDIVVYDAQDAVAEALVAVNAARAARPEVPILVAGETRAAERAPLGVRIYDKWNESDELIAAIDAHLSGDGAADELPPLGPV
jgi:uncharacterized membrane protein (UPF0127 family)